MAAEKARNMSLEMVALCPDPASLNFNYSGTFQGPITGLLGLSGSGKTTLIELIAGIRRPVSGKLLWRGVVWDDPAAKIHVPAERRRVGYVPQDGALFPHLTVKQNLEFGRRNPETGAPSLAAVTRLLEIDTLLERFPTKLSGGERQRVALGRALVSGAQLLLLDEPLANLDRQRRETVLPYLKRVFREWHLPMIYVSHAVDELAGLCDEVGLIHAGRLIQIGPTETVLRGPSSEDAARITGISTRIQGIASYEGDVLTVRVGRQWVRPRSESTLADGEPVWIQIRAEDVLLLKGDAPAAVSARNQWAGQVVAVHRTGSTVRVEIDVGFLLVAQITPAALDDLELRVGEQVWALVKQPAVSVLRA